MNVAKGTQEELNICLGRLPLDTKKITTAIDPPQVQSIGHTN